MPSVVVAEIVGGIVAARLAGAVRKAAALDAWFDEALRLYGARVLPLDAGTARTTGAVLARARAAGQAPGFADLAIAGIALAHGLTLLTRNIRHFVPLGVPACDPYVALPD